MKKLQKEFYQAPYVELIETGYSEVLCQSGATDNQFIRDDNPEWF